jgi:UDP-N-acetylmuramate-alanine ligase
VILAEIYGSRETDTLGMSSTSIASRMDRAVHVADSPDQAASVARAMLHDGDVVIVMGAGDINRAAEALAGVVR